MTERTTRLLPLRGRSVFLTGHTGFKGSWLALWLAKLGARVTGYSLDAPSDTNNFATSRVRDVLHDHVHGDIRDAQALGAAMRRAKPDLVLHLAAQSVVREGYRSPRDTFDVNVMGTIGVLEAVRELDRPCAVICVTSDKCYENVEQVWGYRECDAMGEHDPYGGSKGAAELAIRSWRHSYFPPDRIAQHGVRLASARAGNVVGGGDWKKDALVVDVVKAIGRGEAVALRSPHAFRPWQHVLQALSGYLALAAELLEADDADGAAPLCDGWNFGPVPGNELPVHRVVEILQRSYHRGAGGPGWTDASDPANPRESTILRLSIDKALWELDWRPRWDVEKVLHETARWYRTHAERGADASMQDVTLEQIALYEEAFLGAASPTLVPELET